MKTNGTLKIEKGIPIPKRVRGVGRPISELSKAVIVLKPGESVLSQDTADTAERVRSRVNQLARSRGIPIQKFITRTMPDGVRVWRLK